MLKDMLRTLKDASDAIKANAATFVRNEKYSVVFFGDTGLLRSKESIEKIIAGAEELFAYGKSKVYGRQAVKCWTNELEQLFFNTNVVKVIGPCSCCDGERFDMALHYARGVAEQGKIAVLYTQYRGSKVYIYLPRLGLTKLEEEWAE